MNIFPKDMEVSFLPMEAVGDDGGLNLEQSRPVTEIETGYTYFSEGDVTYAKITPCFENGKGAIMRGLQNGFGFGSTELTVIRPGTDISREYLYYLTISNEFRKNGEAWMYGAGGQKRVPDNFVREFRFAWPPFSEQHTIAVFLDRETARIDELIAKKQRQIELLQEKRSALISHVVTKGLDPNVKMKDSGVEWLGEIPEHWEIVKLKRVASLKSGENITAEETEDDGQYPVYGGNGLRGFSDRYTHDGEFVLIGRQGALCGNINYAEGKFWASEHAVVVTARRPIVLRWMGELLRTMNLNQYSLSAAQPGIAVDRIRELSIPFPSVSEQSMIASFLDQEISVLDDLIERIKHSIRLLREYRTALISAAVTGKIDVREEVA